MAVSSAELRRAQARDSIWRLSPDLLGALNSKGCFETANPAWETVLGWTEDEVRSMSIFELLHPDDLEHTRRLRADAGWRSGSALRQQVSLQGRQLSLDLVDRHTRRRLRLCTGRDITTEREAAAELAAAQDALRQTQKTEAIGQLTGGIAHDFNTVDGHHRGIRHRAPSHR